MRQHRGKAPSLLCLASQWVNGTATAHSLPFQNLSHSTSSAGSSASAQDAVQCSVPDLPARLQQLRDPRFQVDVEVAQGAAAAFSDESQAFTQFTTPQTAPQYNEFLLEGPSRNGPPAGPVWLHTVPPVEAPARASTLGAGSGSDDSVTITPGHRQTWDWSHGPLYSFRDLCRAPIQQHQQQQLLIAAQRGSCTSSSQMGSRAFVFETQRTWQNPLPLPLPDCSNKSFVSGQQPSISDIAAGISHNSSSASRPSSASTAYSSEQFSLQHELLPFCSSSCGQQPHFQRFFQRSSSPTLPGWPLVPLATPQSVPQLSPQSPPQLLCLCQPFLTLFLSLLQLLQMQSRPLPCVISIR